MDLMETKEIELGIKGMSCSHCVRSVTEILKSIPGVVACHVDLSRGTATVTFDPGKTSKDKMVEEINNSDAYKTV